MSLKLSDEAVEAAAEGLAESFGFDNPRYMHPDKGWPKHARAALTAALPHLLPSEEEIAALLSNHQHDYCEECHDSYGCTCGWQHAEWALDTTEDDPIASISAHQAGVVLDLLRGVR